MTHFEQRRPHEVEHEVGVHRPVGRISRRAHNVRETEATENFHRPRIAALHFWIAERRVVLLDQDTVDAALAEIDAECEANRTGPNDQYLRVHTCLAVGS